MLDTTFNMLMRTFITHQIWDFEHSTFNSSAYEKALIELTECHFPTLYKEIKPNLQMIGGLPLEINPSYSKTLIQSPLKITINSFIFHLITKSNIKTNYPIRELLTLVNEFRCECKVRLRENTSNVFLDDAQINAKAFLNGTHGMFRNCNSILNTSDCYCSAINEVSTKIWSGLKFLYDDENVFYIDTDVCYINSNDESLAHQWANKFKFSIQIERPPFVVIHGKKNVIDIDIPSGIPFTVKINDASYSYEP